MVTGGSARWMLFVDGENATLRGQHLARTRGLALSESPYYKRDVFLWLKPKTIDMHATAVLLPWLASKGLRHPATRAFYYTSQSSDDDALNQTREALWSLGFTAEVFKKKRSQPKGKGVDIALTKDLLSNAFLDNYDVAVIFTGDADFQPVISEVKRLGKIVCLMAFEEAGAKINLGLKLSADYFMPVDGFFLANWPSEYPPP